MGIRAMTGVSSPFPTDVPAAPSFYQRRGNILFVFGD
jgi:hypothetical protein